MMKKFLKSFSYAFNGLVYAIKTQRNMRVHLLAMVLVIFLGRWLHILRWEWALLWLCFGGVIGMELMNSALEKTLDTLHPDRHKEIGRAKDMAAAAVLFVSICAVLVAVFVFYQRLSEKLSLLF